MTPKKIVAKEKEPPRKGVLANLKQRFRHDIKQTEVLAGRYDLDKPIVMRYDALAKAFVYHAVTIKTQGNVEIMGWLAGKKKNGSTEVVDAYVGNCNSSGGHTELDANETVKMRNLAKSRGLQLVGQWHNHPSFGTSPSGEDTDTMRTLHAFGVKNPVCLIVNSNNFWLGTYDGHRMRKSEFVVPPKTDNSFGINLGYINGEYAPQYNNFGWGGGWGGSTYVPETFVFDFYGWVGNKVIGLADFFVFWKDLKKYVAQDVVSDGKSD